MDFDGVARKNSTDNGMLNDDPHDRIEPYDRHNTHLMNQMERNTGNMSNYQTIHIKGSRSGSKSSQGSSNGPLLIDAAPKDRFLLVQLAFFLLGVTTLLPWNFFITATDYWMYKFRNVSLTYDETGPVSTERTPLQTFFESYLSIAANLPMVGSMVVNSIWGQRIRQEVRIYASLGIMLGTFSATTIFVNINTDQIQYVFFGTTITLVVITSIFSAIFQASIFGLVASFPNKCMLTMVCGQGFAGLFAVFLQIASMLNNSGPEESALWYFLISTIVLAASIVVYWLMDNEYTRYYLEVMPNFTRGNSGSYSVIVNENAILQAFKQIWPLALATMMAFWVSLSVYPGVCVLVLPQNPNTSTITGRLFTPLSTFLMFNIGDIAGRVMSGVIMFPKRWQKALLALSVIRLIIPPIILLCNVHPRSILPVVFDSDWIFITSVAVLSVTSGYIFSSSMVMASSNSKKEHLELTGFILATFLGIGLSLGSLTSNILLRII